MTFLSVYYRYVVFLDINIDAYLMGRFDGKNYYYFVRELLWSLKFEFIYFAQ